MKKLDPPSSLNQRIEGVRIARDDLDFIVELFRRDVGPSTLSDDHFEFDSVSEFIEHRGIKPQKLQIEARSASGETKYRSISVKFEGNSAWLYGTQDTPFHEAKEFLYSKRSWTFSALNPWAWFFVTMGGVVVLQLVLGVAEKAHKTVPAWVLYFFGIPLSLIIIGSIYRKFSLGLCLTRSHEGGFWKRNAEKIIVGLIGAVIGSVLHGLIKYL